VLLLAFALVPVAVELVLLGVGVVAAAVVAGADSLTLEGRWALYPVPDALETLAFAVSVRARVDSFA
jgi:multisubunit Na+/H+ antiporter MnhC subunit